MSREGIQMSAAATAILALARAEREADVLREALAYIVGLNMCFEEGTIQAFTWTKAMEGLELSRRIRAERLPVRVLTLDPREPDRTHTHARND